jgi:hypothetical protein
VQLGHRAIVSGSSRALLTLRARIYIRNLDLVARTEEA